jgi:hypothetical protein
MKSTGLDDCRGAWRGEQHSDALVAKLKIDDGVDRRLAVVKPLHDRKGIIRAGFVGEGSINASEVSIPLMTLPIFHDGYVGVHLFNRSSTVIWHTRSLGEVIDRRANP